MEDFIFDDDVDDVGAEVEAHCPKCKADTSHVIVSKYEDEIRRVQCKTCDDVHSYRKPRGEEEGEAEPTKPSKKVKAKPTWEQVMAKSKKQPRAYALGEYFKEMEIVSHPKFGVGYVTENIGSDKIEVTFQADKRVLIHNRKGLNLPVAMLRPLAQPASGKGKGAKGKGQGKKGEAPVVAPAAPPKPVAAAKPVPAAKPVAPKPVAAAKPVKPKQQKAAARPAAKKPPAKAPQPVKRAAKAASHKPAAKPSGAKLKKPARAAIRAKAPAKKMKKSR
jgi:hypothetical protein